ncbi:protein-glutamate O-methyltransferase CheR [Donghicola sp. C2-DW-16]|uniref:protein-glutamate O-methyltransferase n=1 Tax=Donghicola mangrovi TaxID=2729614 RepID=A0A850Q688_9RHOB|nr:protein-glutamate O-methyltransferase CheR [Donghicola mangrovi]NVO22065.1 protein-glutamate O-methyltransferase CheR [Donghicola mangrovi]NVO26344.1 protein-glutamate O-methyltransferase CheR [Donghicola mangrovi]
MTVVDQAGYEQIRNWLSDRCGINFADNKQDLLRQRLARVTRRFEYRDLNSLARDLLNNPRQDVELAVMHAASTNHTYFFREPEVLDNFKSLIIPKLAERPEMRVWSAAASTGDEAYTVVIMIAEALGMNALKRLKILGTDISEPVVQRAEMGVFPTRQFAHTDPMILRRYFEPTGMDQYRVRPELRDCCTFRRMNLKARPYPFIHPFQVVFCRNILYYFDRADQIGTLEAIYDATEPGGWLITSVTESLRDLGSRWEPVAAGIYRRPA